MLDVVLSSPSTGAGNCWGQPARQLVELAERHLLVPTSPGGCGRSSRLVTITLSFHLAVSGFDSMLALSPFPVIRICTETGTESSSRRQRGPEVECDRERAG